MSDGLAEWWLASVEPEVAAPHAGHPFRAPTPPATERPLELIRIFDVDMDHPAVAMITSEVDFVYELAHPNVSRIVALGRTGAGCLFIAMERLRGWRLDTVLDRAAYCRRPLPVAAALYIAGELLGALDYLHRWRWRGRPNEIVHRGVAPDSIFVTASGGIKLLDAGLRRLLGLSQVGRPQPRFGAAYAHLSPEQARGLPPTTRSDLFAAGVVVHEMLTCRPLFTGNAPLAILAAIGAADVAAPSTVRAGLPNDLDRAVRCALARAPDNRYADAAAMARALDEVAVRHDLDDGVAALRVYLDGVGAMDAP
ncbi:MAG: serine/threonine-protein kinase [Myxococcota bacterium]